MSLDLTYSWNRPNQRQSKVGRKQKEKSIQEHSSLYVGLELPLQSQDVEEFYSIQYIISNENFDTSLQ